MTEILHKELTYKIVGCAMEVHSVLGFGFLEKVYENALMVELRTANIPAVQQQAVKVQYKGEIVGDYIADIVIDNKIILELKSARAICDEHVAQMLNYLKATGFELGLLINFGEHKLEYKRLVFSRELTPIAANKKY